MGTAVQWLGGPSSLMTLSWGKFHPHQSEFLRFPAVFPCFSDPLTVFPFPFVFSFLKTLFFSFILFVRSSILISPSLSHCFLLCSPLVHSVPLFILLPACLMCLVSSRLHFLVGKSTNLCRSVMPSGNFTTAAATQECTLCYGVMEHHAVINNF